jgi:hypothetical protein
MLIPWSSGEGPRTVSGRGLFAEAGGSALGRAGSASRALPFVSGKIRWLRLHLVTHHLGAGGPPRRFSVLEQLQQIASQEQLARMAPVVRSHSGPARLSHFAVSQEGTLRPAHLSQLHQPHASDALNGGSAGMAGVMQADFIECSYCYDSVPQQDIMRMPCCLLTCCQSCMCRDFTVRINDGSTLIRCHHCGTSVSDDFIRDCVTIQTFNKFLRFKAARENPLLRSCSKCSHVQEGKSSKPSMTCAGCNYVYGISSPAFFEPYFQTTLLQVLFHPRRLSPRSVLRRLASQPRCG